MAKGGQVTAGSAADDDQLTQDILEANRPREEMIHYFFKDTDEEFIYHDQENVSMSTATRDRKTTVGQNIATRNNRGHDQTSNNMSSKHSTYFIEQNIKNVGSASRMSSTKGRSLKVLKGSQTIQVQNLRPQTSYASQLPTKKPYFVRFQSRGASHNRMRNDASLRQSITHPSNQQSLLGGTNNKPSDAPFAGTTHPGTTTSSRRPQVNPQ